MMSKVSILIPCYNVEQYLPQCLDSIINQTYHDLQIVLVDDGSSDNTLAVAQQYAAKDSRIEVYHQENQGVAAARNVLLSKIKGDYFLFVDSDDWIEPDMVECMVANATIETADIVTCGMVLNDSPVSKKYEEKIYDRENAVKRFLYHKEFKGSLCNKLINVSLLRNIPKFCCEISYGEDALFCWELLKDANKIVCTDRQLYHYRMNNSSLSHEGFGPKKFSAHAVWTRICRDTETFYPEFADIAKGHFCFSMLVLYRNALRSGYPKDELTGTLAKVVSRYREQMRAKKCAGLKWYLYSWIVCVPYDLLKKK